MRLKSGVGILVLIMFSVAFAPIAEAKRVSGQFSGSGTFANLDLDRDGIASGGSNTSVGDGTFGPTHGWGVSELLPWDGTSFCSSTELRQYFSASATTTRIDSGDAFYTEFEDGSLCFNFRDNTFTFSGHDRVTGGSGIFEAATGRIATTGSGKVLSRDAEGRAALSAFRGVTRGEIIFRSSN